MTYAECHILYIVRLNVIMLCVDVLNAVLLNVIMPNVSFYIARLNVNMLCVIRLNVVILSIIMLIVFQVLHSKVGSWPHPQT